MDKDFSEKVTNYFKNDYRERGIIKWRGYFLSDHTSALKDWKKDTYYVEKRLDAMPIEDIYNTCIQAMKEFRKIEIQLDSVTTELKQDRNIGGVVQAINNRYLKINNTIYSLEQIRAVIIK